MNQYDTGAVPGDTKVAVEDLKVGDVVRVYMGLADTSVVESIESEYRQGAKRVYHVQLDCWGVPTVLSKGDTLDLPTGGPRPVLEPA
jgi:hypothetical protein